MIDYVEMAVCECTVSTMNITTFGKVNGLHHFTTAVVDIDLTIGQCPMNCIYILFFVLQD